MKLSRRLDSFSLDRIFLVLLFPCLFYAFPVAAHHPFEGGGESFSFLEGIISGLAHPLLGVDHLLFLLSVGLIGRFSFSKWVPSLLLCGLLGAILSQFFPGILEFEFSMGISLIFAAFVVLEKLTPLIMFPLILFHGYLLGSTMVGAEPTPLLAYFIGMLISEAFLILMGLIIYRRFNKQKLLFSGILIGSGMILSYGTIAY